MPNATPRRNRLAAQPWRRCAVVSALAAFVFIAVLTREAYSTLEGADLPAPAHIPGSHSPALSATSYVFIPSVFEAPTPTPAPAPLPTPTPSDPMLSEMGLVFVNSAETPSSDARIARGVDSGAHFDRFPIYWNLIEATAGNFDWSKQDAALSANHRHGLRTLAILLGTPGVYATSVRSQGYSPMPPVGASFLRYQRDVSIQGTCSGGPTAPTGLSQPAFSDGTDLPAAGKTANLANPWARFVELAVQRYRPGGSAGLDVQDWEIWNEPDLCQFWSGTAAEYARLLKVAYLVIKQHDPDAVVLWGGLAHFENAQFLYDLVDTLRSDPLSATYDGFFDAAATHQYSIVANGYAWTKRIRVALDAAGWQDKPIWVTESGVPVCDDYPGPSCPSPWRARPAEQAAYVWQNIAYTRLAGGGPVFHFMLHDDCGNVVAVNSPDGFGVVKNEATSYCSPAQAQLRVGYTAYKLAAQYLRGTDLLWSDTVGGAVTRVAFYEPTTRERRLLAWDLTATDRDVTIPAAGSQALRIAVDGTQATLTPADGQYSLHLAGATNRNWPDGSGNYNIGIYGAPYLLVERDTLPPTTAMGELPAASPKAFNVTWSASDTGSGVASVTIWYRQGDGPWTVWLANQAASGTATFSGQTGQHYRFSALGIDRAGNQATNPVTQAETWVTDESQRVAVDGQVIDIAGQSAAGVAVAIGDATATADSTGHFQLSVLVGRWDVKVAGRTVVHGQSFAAATSLSLLELPATNAVANGDFEQGTTGWQTGGSCPLATEQQSGTNDSALRLATGFVANPGVPGEDGSNGGNSTLQQVIQVPTGAPHLALRYRVDSQETQSGHDKFEVIIIQGTRADYVLTQGTASDWSYLSVDLQKYAGQQVTLALNVYQSSASRPTSALVDLVAVGTE